MAYFVPHLQKITSVLCVQGDKFIAGWPSGMVENLYATSSRLLMLVYNYVSICVSVCGLRVEPCFRPALGRMRDCSRVL